MQAKASASNILKKLQCHLYKASYTPVGTLRDILSLFQWRIQGAVWLLVAAFPVPPRGLWDPFDINLPFLKPTEIEMWL